MTLPERLQELSRNTDLTKAELETVEAAIQALADSPKAAVIDNETPADNGYKLNVFKLFCGFMVIICMVTSAWALSDGNMPGALYAGVIAVALLGWLAWFVYRFRGNASLPRHG